MAQQSNMIRVDYADSVKDINDLRKYQIPFAFSMAINRTVNDARDAIRQKMPSQFIIRRQWVIKGVIGQYADRDNHVGAVLSRDRFMSQHETGAIKKPKSGRMLAIPLKGIRRNKRTVIKKSKYPAALLRQDNYYIDDSQTKRPIIYKRFKRAAPKPMYLLKPKATIRPAWNFEKTVADTVARRFDANFGYAFGRAIATA